MTARGKAPRWKATADPEAISMSPIRGWTVIDGTPKNKRRPKVTVLLNKKVTPKRKPTKNPYGIE